LQGEALPFFWKLSDWWCFQRFYRPARPFPPATDRRIPLSRPPLFLRFQRILSDYGVVVFPREGYDLEEISRNLLEECMHMPTPYVLDASLSVPEGFSSLEETLARAYHIRIVDAPLVNVSSTQIREGLAAGKDMSALLM